MPIVPASGASLELGFEVLQLASARNARQPPALERGDARRIIAAIFQPLQRRDDLRRRRSMSQNADNSAHGPSPPPDRQGEQALGQRSRRIQITLGVQL